MPNCLILTLQGVFQAWGKHSFETYRPTELFPTRSGLTGFLAAAIGITRDDTEQCLALDKSYKYAARCDMEHSASAAHVNARAYPVGRKMMDFHTVQQVRTVASKPKPTEVTHREYLEDQCFTIALMESKNPVYTLQQISAAVMKPSFSLHLGRKNCPLCTPPLRGICDADSLYDALVTQKPSCGLVYSEELVEANHFVQTVRDVPMGGRKFDVRKVYCYEMGA